MGHWSWTYQKSQTFSIFGFVHKHYLWSLLNRLHQVPSQKTCKNMLNSNLKPCIQCVCLLQCSAHKCDFLKWLFSEVSQGTILTITRHRKLRLTRFWCHFKAKPLSFRMISKSQFWFWGPYCSFRYDAPHIYFVQTNEVIFCTQCMNEACNFSMHSCNAWWDAYQSMQTDKPSVNAKL